MKNVLYLLSVVLFLTSCAWLNQNKKPENAVLEIKEENSEYNIYPEIERSAKIELSTDLLQKQPESLTIPLFDDKKIELKKRNEQDAARTGLLYEVIGDPTGSVIISEVNGRYAIDIILARGEIYKIRYRAKTGYILQKIDQSKFRREGSTPVRETGSAGDPLPCTQTDPNTEIDVMVVYTDDVMTAIGDRDAIEAEIYLALYETNLGYQNSNVTQRLGLVHVSEINYAQDTDITVDLARLESSTDGIIDGVHALRDAHAADLVCMLKYNDPSWCGWANTMTTVSDAFEDNAFSVVSYNCATGNFSFGHELGHNMGAQHDCAVDNDTLPYRYAHGYVETSPSDASVGQWRTIMAYDDDCGTCPRVLYWSNPNVNYPPGGTSPDPMGTSSGTCQADNRLALNNTASTVANFRCRSRGPSNAWMKDTWNDTGAEPDPATASQSMWKSPYIWVRNSQDVNRLHQHRHENPQIGTPTYVYVKIHNGGPNITGDLVLHYAHASTSLSWPSAWTVIDTQKNITLNASTTQILEFDWATLPGSGHYCLVARWLSSADPMATPEGSDIGVNTRNNNNIVWRNVNIVPMSGGDEYTAEMNFEGRRGELLFEVSSENPEHDFLEHGEVLVVFDKQTTAYIRNQSIEARGMTAQNNGFIIQGDTDTKLIFHKVEDEFLGSAQINFRTHDDIPQVKYILDVRQLTFSEDGDARWGGVEYEVNLEAIK